MAKAPIDLDVGDIVYIINAKEYKRIIDIRSWQEFYNDTVGPLATISNRRIANLDSGTSEMYFIESVEVLRDITLTLTFRNLQMQGSQGTGSIVITENGRGDPLMLNKFCYNEPWYAAVTELLGLTLTALNLANFKGVTLYLDNLTDDEKAKVIQSKNFTEVPG